MPYIFSLLEIEDLPPATQEQLYNELMDKDAQKELEEDCVEPGTAAINWSEEIRINLGSRLHALWNRQVTYIFGHIAGGLTKFSAQLLLLL